MHETGLVQELLEKVKRVAVQSEARRVMAVSVRIGPLAGVSPEHLREHWEEESRGTVAAEAELRITLAEDMDDDLAGSLVLESVDIERDDEE